MELKGFFRKNFFGSKIGIFPKLRELPLFRCQRIPSFCFRKEFGLESICRKRNKLPYSIPSQKKNPDKETRSRRSRIQRSKRTRRLFRKSFLVSF
ncbi:hypothetical protein LEP1GSC060_0167 [Leptospira weilii serovar Ranarum str. ICFT]|uniref:Uncharacterized protein n=1 Tax=Leptospira weilii serovar Ranarum str. ICFT TaxID=1218598 RepID=N1WF16_9LEPT|nr:hypothetical protein LEP1GSC060_0167 [Leptospira weilii serovar Ranarum str. ICFT]